MSRPPVARESVLDAFEAILIDRGERFATMDATAKAAGVSKGGLLYHFGSKQALADGLLARPGGERSGSGLGLAIVRRVMALHGGHLAVRNTQPGLRVVLEFPAG